MEMGTISYPHLPRVRAFYCFFVVGLTGQQVKRAAVGAEGNVLDHYSRAAMQKHWRSWARPWRQRAAETSAPCSAIAWKCTSPTGPRVF